MKVSVVVCAAALALSAFGEEPCVYEFAPEVVGIPAGEASASKFVWAADGEPTNGGVSYYRHTFTLDAKPSRAMLSRCLDDSGEVFVNGRALEGHRTVTSYLVAGQNTIAVSLTNATSVSAALYLLECAYSSGATSYVHSCASVKGTVHAPDAGWEQPGFNDAAWPQVTVVGDALTEPWASRFAGDSRIGLCLTPEDKARIAAAQGPSQAFETAWAGLEQEPDPVARIVYRGNSPFVELNGSLHAPDFNICQVGDAYNESAIVRLSKVGFDIVQINFFADNFYKGEGRPYDFSSVSNKVRRLLELNPDAYVVISPRFMMNEWAQAHPDEQVGYETGAADPSAGDEFRERVLRPSPASDLFRALVVDMIKKLGEYVETQPWRKRLVGFRLSYGTYTEWCYFGMYEGPDNGLRMQEKFRAYMKAKRNVDDATIPPISARKHEDPDPSQPNRNGDLLDPAQDQLVLDYYDCLINTMADFLLEMADTAKQAFPGRLVGAYYGYLYDDHPPEGATSLLDKVLSSPNVDILSCPAYYSKDGRRAGGSYVTRTIPSLFRRYGKLALLEDDSRFHHIRNWLQSQNDGLALCTETPRETEMCMRRNMLNPFFDGGGIQLNDPITQSGSRPHAFDDPAVFRAVEDSRTALAMAGDAASESGNEVAVVFSTREAIRRDGGKGSYFTWNLYQTSILYLNRSGIPFDLLSLEDYIANPRGYKIVMFLNAFYLTPDERKALVQRTRRPGMTAIWIGPAGGVTENGFDDAAMSALTGVTASGVARRSNIVSTDSAASRYYTSHGIYYVKTLDSGARSIIVPEMPAGSDGSGPGEYAKILKAAGARQYTPEGNYFRRHGDIFMFHTGTNGTHTTITLPDNVVKVRELFTGAEYTSNVITLESDGPNTWLFRAAAAGLWTVGESVVAVLDANGVLSIDGTGPTYDFANAADVPWDPTQVRSVVVGDDVILGANALASLSDATTLGGVPLRKLRSGLGSAEVPAGMVLVSQTELEAASAAALEVANGTALLGISVCTNADLTAEQSNWSPVSFKKSDLEVSADGTRILAPIPANAEKGFMILRSGD
ncbi:MAG: hypothetical protein K6G91_04050 [Kiritimatiellae bacterium]|nr:hypothetical protein [Kiritimatiellia bacterium]